MKMIFLALLLISSISIAQDFKLSSDYKVTGLEYEKRMKMYDSGEIEDTILTYLVNSSDQTDHLKAYNIVNVDLFDSVLVREWIDPGYKNVERILWVQFEYAACCYDYEVHYYLVTKKGNLVPLPSIYYSMCDYPGEIEEYEYHPDEGVIHHVINMYVGKGQIEESTEVETLFWDGKKLSGPE